MSNTIWEWFLTPRQQLSMLYAHKALNNALLPELVAIIIDYAFTAIFKDNSDYNMLRIADGSAGLQYSI